MRSGAGRFFINVALALTGSKVGGPAKASVLSSCLMASVSGSAVANVVTTGSFTIPLMKRHRLPQLFRRCGGSLRLVRRSDHAAGDGCGGIYIYVELTALQ